MSAAETCTCGHSHNWHINSSWTGEFAGEIGICRYYDTVITGYKTTTYDNDSDSDDVGWQPSQIHFNYGGNSAPYVANSYQTTYGNITYITPRGGSSYGVTSTQYAIRDKKYCAESCVECRCRWCLSDEGKAQQRQQRENNRIAWETKQATARKAQETIEAERKLWRESTFRQRCHQRSVIRAVLRSIKEVFICGASRSKKQY